MIDFTRIGEFYKNIFQKNFVQKFFKKRIFRVQWARKPIKAIESETKAK